MIYESLGERFATHEEVRQISTEVSLNSESTDGAGLPLLSDTMKVSVSNDDTHSLIIGGSGSKKNRLIIFLTVYLLAMHDECMFINDPKGETLARTGHFLKKHGYNIRVLDFRNIGKRGDFWNPLVLAYKHYKNGDIDKAQELFSDFINAIAASQREGAKDPFWPATAEALGTALLPLLAEIAEPEEMNVGSFARMCSLDSMNEIEKLSLKLPEDSISAINLKGVLSGAEKTRMSVYITLFSMVSMFLNQKNLITALSNSTFDLEEMATEKTAIFVITPDEKSNYNFTIALMVQQLYQVLIAKAQENGGVLARRVNFILDEFCNTPHINDFTNMISAARSRNIRFFLVIQSLHQLQAKYGEDDAQTIIGNCANLVYLHSRELPLLRMLSELCGERYMSDGSTRPLVTPAQLQRLSKEKGEVMYFVGRLHPYVTQMPDIDAYEIFKGYPEMDTPEATSKEAKILPIKDAIDDILCGVRPIPFTGEEESYVEKYKKQSRADLDANLQAELEKKFEELFGSNS